MADMYKVARRESVYPPSDDSFALADAVRRDLGDASEAELRRTRCTRVVEVGSGSGYVLCSVALKLRELGADASFVATDINAEAVDATKETMAAHSIETDVRETRFLEGLEDMLRDQVDILLFNPPYVPTPVEETQKGGLAASWAGGERGRQVIDEFLPLVPEYLSSRGLFYMVTIAQNHPPSISAWLEQLGLQTNVALVVKADEEKLTILRARRRA